jgi:arginase family enzyme
MLREFAATKTIVSVDFVEFNPFYDNAGQQTASLVRRTMFQFLTGIAMKKYGIAPDFVHPRISGEP